MSQSVLPISDPSRQAVSAKALKLAPVLKREALPEQIVRQLVGLVKSGELRPGDRLPAERTLADELGVARPTLREALRALQLLGILDIRHGGGVFVTELEPDTLLEPLHLFLSLDPHNLETILEARKVIEGALLAFAAHIIDDTRIARLEANLCSLEQLIDSSTADGDLDRGRFNALAEEFRAVIEEAVDNPILVRAVKSLDILSAAVRSRITATGSPERLLANHKRIAEALIAHDPPAAHRALELHIDYLCEVCGVTLRGQRDA